MAEAKVSIEKLNGENYFVWKYRVEMLLMKERLWSVVNGNPPLAAPEGTNAQQIEDWQVRDDQARGWIGLLVDENQLCHIRNSKTAKEAWQSLKNHHEKDTLSNKICLIRRICSTKMSETDNMETHISKLTSLFQKLIDLGEELKDSWVVGMILSSLPHSYDTLITALETRPEADLTLSLVKTKLLSEYNRRKEINDSNIEDKEKVLKTIQRSVTCFFCNKEGHIKRECTKYKAWKEKQAKFETVKNDQQVKYEKLNKVKESEEFLFMVFKEKNEGWEVWGYRFRSYMSHSK